MPDHIDRVQNFPDITILNTIFGQGQDGKGGQGGQGGFGGKDGQGPRSVRVVMVVRMVRLAMFSSNNEKARTWLSVPLH